MYLCHEVLFPVIDRGVSAERASALSFLLRAHRSNDAGAGYLRDLDRGNTDPATSGGDQHVLAGLQCGLSMKSVVRSVEGDRDRRAFFKGQVRWQGNSLIRGETGLFRITSTQSAAKYPVARLDVSDSIADYASTSPQTSVPGI